MQPYVNLIIKFFPLFEILIAAFFRNITDFSHLWTLEDEETTVLLNVANRLSRNEASFPRRMDSPISMSHTSGKLMDQLRTTRGPGSVVGIATGYGLDGPGIESRWRLDFPNLSRPALGPTQPPVQ